MYHVITEEMLAKQKEDLLKETTRIFEESAEKAKRRREFDQNNPKCPHCGHKPTYPIWLMF